MVLRPVIGWGFPVSWCRRQEVRSPEESASALKLGTWALLLPGPELFSHSSPTQAEPQPGAMPCPL